MLTCAVEPTKPLAVQVMESETDGRLPVEVDERTLIARAKGGDLDAFNDLLVRHQDRVFNHSLRLMGNHEDAADLAQEVFLKVHRKLHQFRGDSAFTTWLYRVTANLAINMKVRERSRGGSRTISMDQPSANPDHDRPIDPQDSAPGPRANAAGGQAMHSLLACLGEMRFEHRQVLILRFFDELSYEEIAEVLEANLGTVKSRISRARAELRDLLDGRVDFTP